MLARRATITQSRGQVGKMWASEARTASTMNPNRRDTDRETPGRTPRHRDVPGYPTEVSREVLNPVDFGFGCREVIIAAAGPLPRHVDVDDR